MFQNVLVAYDGSDNAREAARIAGEMARCLPSGATLWLVTVMDPAGRDLGEPYLSEYIQEQTGAGQKLLDEAVAQVGQDARVYRELLFGQPADSILQVAETRGCELIVIGGRGPGSLKEWILGSQVQRVINNARCPVLVVK